MISSSTLSIPSGLILCARSLASLRASNTRRAETRLSIGRFENPAHDLERVPRRTLQHQRSHSAAAERPAALCWSIVKTSSLPGFVSTLTSRSNGVVCFLHWWSRPSLEAPCCLELDVILLLPQNKHSWHVHSQGPETRLETHESLSV